jgi:hypothetical protein
MSEMTSLIGWTVVPSRSLVQPPEQLAFREIKEALHHKYGVSYTVRPRFKRNKSARLEGDFCGLSLDMDVMFIVRDVAGGD